MIDLKVEKVQRGHFLNDQQKSLKQKIMEDCLKGLFENLENNSDIFTDAQEILDVFGTV